MLAKGEEWKIVAVAGAAERTYVDFGIPEREPVTLVQTKKGIVVLRASLASASCCGTAGGWGSRGAIRFISTTRTASATLCWPSQMAGRRRRRTTDVKCKRQMAEWR